VSKRKTISVKDLVILANHALTGSGSMFTPEYRKGVCGLISTVLHTTGNYEGFRYLDAREVPPGEKPGIVYGLELNPNEFPDETRRAYYLPRHCK